MQKIRESGAPAVLLIPDWPRQPWHEAALQLAQTVKLLEAPPEQIWVGHRYLNPRWRLMMLECNMALEE